MQFAGSIMAWLKHTNNLNETVNVNWCHLRDLPEAPVEYIVDTKEHKYRYWKITIPLEMLFLTEGIY